MQKIRFKKMLCLGLLTEKGFVGGFIDELNDTPEVIRFFEWKFASKRNQVIFLNKQGKPFTIAPNDLSQNERIYWGII